MNQVVLSHFFLFLLYKAINIETVPLNEFFPYGAGNGDTLFSANDDLSTSAIVLAKIFPYFNNNHRQIYLSNNGLFSFLGPITQYVPDSFPLNDNRRLIAGFWSDIDTRGYVSNGNQVFYQIHTNLGNTAIFNKATSYVQRFFPSEKAFNPSMVITGTWYRVGAYSSQTNLLNTFQIVLATDEIRSFTFLLYHDLQWSSPSNSNSVGGQAGFNAGDGVIFQMLPFSRTSNVVQLTNFSNVNVPGLYVFRTDTETIYISGCGNSTRLMFRPQRGSQLGSTALIIQGPCFNNIPIENVTCRFGNSTVVNAVAANEFEAICLTPASSLPGTVNIYLSTDHGQTYRPFWTAFTYTPIQIGMASGEDTEVVISHQNGLIIGPGDNLNISWLFSNDNRRLWSNQTMLIQILLLTVRLNTNNSGINTGVPIVLQDSLLPITGTQSVSINIPTINDNAQAAFIRIIIRENATNIIYANATGICSDWAFRQQLPTTWNKDLQFCPMTLTQARIARCCYDRDPLCNDVNNSSLTNCTLHRGRVASDEVSAFACYISRFSGSFGAGSKCCYGLDGQLITRGLGAGADSRYWPTSFPILNFFEDSLPYMACCLMSSDAESCNSYFNFRPIRRGSNTRNVWGGTWGDPHYTTLDGSAFTFNGYGEYTYLAAAAVLSAPAIFNQSTQNFSFISQVRTTPIFLENGTIASRATITRGFAGKSNHSQAENVSITVSRREYLIVRRGSEVLDVFAESGNTISSADSLIFNYPELTIERNRTSGTITLSWTIGISVQITPIILTSPINGTIVLSVGVSVAGSFESRTYGLMGTYDSNTTNDLRIPNGTIIGTANTMTLEQIHREFGQQWAINPAHSLFYYESGDSALFYSIQNQSFTPSFDSPHLNSSENNIAQAACNISSTNQSTWTYAQRTCYFDVAVTNDTNFGRTSLVTGNEIVDIALHQRSPPEFNQNLGLIVTIEPSMNVTLNFTATSPYTSVIYYSLQAAPSNCIFNNRTGVLHWQAPPVSGSNVVVRVAAVDNQYSLMSVHELTIQVRGTNITTTTVGIGASGACRIAGNHLWFLWFYLCSIIVAKILL